MTSGKVPAKAFAVFAVALMLAITVVPLVFSGSQTDAVEGATSVTYHGNHDKNGSESESISYNGIVSAEYNPVYNDMGWKAPTGTYTSGTIKLEISYWGNHDGKTFELPEGMVVENISYNRDYIRATSDGNTYTVHDSGGGWTAGLNRTITISFHWNFEYSLVFGGWADQKVGIDEVSKEGINYYHPGDVFGTDSNATVPTDLYAVWLTPNVYLLPFDDSQGLGKITGTEIRTSVPYRSSEENREDDYRGYGDYDRVVYALVDNEYTRIYAVSDGMETGDYLTCGTYRSESGSNDRFYIRETWYDWGYNYDYHIPLKGNVIIDNVKLVTQPCDSSLSHGNDSDHGIFANGYRLIIGTNVSTGAMSGNDSTVAREYPQIFGGIAIDTYSHASATARDSIPGTDLVIFSGVYYNIVAGNHDGNIEGNTHLVIRGGTVLDTVVGGNSSSTEGRLTMNGETVVSSTNTIMGSTYVYILGGCLPADSHQETTIGSRDDFSGIPSGVTLTESTILTGGSNNGKVHRGTNVFISGDAVLWDVQGGGRRGQSTVDGVVSVEVSGQAMIRHVLCGSITDGISERGAGTPSDLQSYSGSVKDVKIVVKHSAMVASLFGAGYDTYYSPTYASMLDGGTIDIDIIGGTVGYVYGGGYRGAVGYSGNLPQSSSESPIESISITVSGGSVGEVYGGGRGGVDKVLYNADSSRV